MSALPSTCEICSGSAAQAFIEFHGCKMPSTYTLLGAADTVHSVIDLYACENADTTSERVAYRREALAGSITYDKAVYLTGADGALANDGGGGTQSFSWLMSSASALASVNEALPLTTPWVYAWVGSTGSKNLDMYVGATETLDDSEVWVEYDYLGTTGVEALTRASTQKVPAASAAVYTTTGGTWSSTVTNSYYLRKTVTVNEIGLVRARICVAAASKAIYANPKIIVS